ncbi:MAG: hypothetical protein PHE83_14905 [Opitutaceae bacterium]|nr:hypothetical protein [Opitutaceae bacterium]
MASPPKAERGFTLLEVLIALTFSAFLLGVVAAASALYRGALRTSGTDIFAGRVLPISPDDSIASAANTLAAELASLAAQADFIVVLDQPWDATDLATRTSLAPLGQLDTAILSHPGALRTALTAAGFPIGGDGYTVIMIGRQFRIMGALTVTAADVTAPNGDGFRDYHAILLGDTGGGYGQLYQYEFVTANAVKQSVLIPTLDGAAWTVTLPDPGLAAETPGGIALTNPLSTLSYALPANL